ncbi:MAG: hypothetical protein ACI3XJ_12655 [Oscillospiraceae bacterium]
MSQEQLANILITNNQALGYNKLNSVQMYNALVQAGVGDETAKAAVKQALQTKATNAQTAATVAATGATGGLTAAIKGLGVAMLANPIMTAFVAIAAAVTIAIVAQKKYNKAIQESIEKAQELQDAYKQASDEISNNITTVNDLSKEFATLSKGVGDHGENISLSADEYDRYLEIVQQLVDINPALVKGYDAEGNAIINKNSAIQATIDLLKEQRALELAEATSDDNNWDIAKGLTNSYKQELKDAKEAQDELIRSMSSALRSQVTADDFNRIADMFGTVFDTGKSFDITDANDNWYWGTMISYIIDNVEDAGIIISENIEYINSLLDQNSDEAVAFRQAMTAWQTAQKTADKAAVAYQSHMKLIAQASVGYDELSDSSKDFVNTWIESQKLTSDMSREQVDNITDSIQNMVGLLSSGIEVDGKEIDLNSELDKLFKVDWNSIGGEWYNSARDKAEEILTILAQALDLSDQQVIDLKVALGLVIVDENGKPVDARTYYIEQLRQRGLALGDDDLSGFSTSDLKLLLTVDVAGMDVDDLSVALDAVKNKANEASDALNDFSALTKHLEKDTDALYTAISNLQSGNISAIFEEEALDDLLEKFPDLVDELNDYSKGLITAEQLQDAFNNAINDFNADEIYDGINNVVSAAKEYGAESNKVKQAVQNLAQTIPGLVDALYDEETGHLKVDAAALSSANSLYEVAQAAIEAARQSDKMDLSNSIKEMEKMRDAALEAAAAVVWYGNAAEMAQRIDAYDNALGFDDVINNLKQQMADIDSYYDTILSQLTAAQNRYSRVSSSSTKDTEEYIAEIDKFREATERLNRVQAEADRLELHLSNTDDLSKQIEYHKQLIDVYQDEQDALHELNEQRDAYIQSQVDVLRQRGFNVEYDPTNNKFFVENLEHLNDLVASSKGSYDTLQEATNAYRKETEDLIESLESLNDANAENSEAWWDLQYSIRSAKVDIVNNLQEIVSQASEAVDTIQNVYDTLKEAADEYASNGGFITVDTFQKIVELGPQYMQYLEDENGLLVINEERINAVIKAKTEQLALENAMAYVERLRLALEDDSVESLNSLLYATTETTNATWGLVYANLALLNLSDTQYQAALHNINALRSLAVNAVTSIGQVTGSFESELNDMKNGVEDILQYVMDMLEDEVNRQIDSLEDLKDQYKDIIEQRKEMLQLAERERKYEEEVADKTSEIAKLQARIDALSLDDSRAAAIERASLEEQLADLKKDLADTQREHSIDCVEDALDQELDAFEKQQDEQIKILEDSISSTQKIYSMAIDYIESNFDTLYDSLISWNTSYGQHLNSEISTAWDNCLAAAQRYGSFVNALNNIDADIASASGSSNNTVVGTVTQVDTVEIVESLIAKMKANSAAWFSGDQTALANENASYASRISSLIGEPVVRGDDGVWYIGSVGGPKLYDDYKKYCYHTGGVVGNVPTLKQNELLSLVNKGEVVLNATQQSNLMAMLDQLKPLNALKEALTSFRSSALTSASAGGPTFKIDAPVYVDGTLPDKQIMELLKSHSRDIATTVYSYITKM